MLMDLYQQDIKAQKYQIMKVVDTSDRHSRWDVHNQQKMKRRECRSREQYCNDRIQYCNDRNGWNSDNQSDNDRLIRLDQCGDDDMDDDDDSMICNQTDYIDNENELRDMME